jgi:hypothetical protein
MARGKKSDKNHRPVANRVFAGIYGIVVVRGLCGTGEFAAAGTSAEQRQTELRRTLWRALG